MNHPLISVKNLKKYFQTKKSGVMKALDDITLDIREGEIFGLLGVNGAGKTTLSSILATLHPPTSGEVLLHGRSIYDNVITYRKKMSFCPQAINISANLTVEQLLDFAGRYYGLEESERKSHLEHLIERYGLDGYRKMTVDVLSGGYKRRLLIARALMSKPRFLILDEPTVGLDPHIRRGLWGSIKELRDEGVSILLTTHYLDEADVLSDRVCILDAGKIRLIDTPENLKKAHGRESLEDVFIQLTEEEVKT